MNNIFPKNVVKVRRVETKKIRKVELVRLNYEKYVFNIEQFTLS